MRRKEVHWTDFSVLSSKLEPFGVEYIIALRRVTHLAREKDILPLSIRILGHSSWTLRSPAGQASHGHQRRRGAMEHDTAFKKEEVRWSHEDASHQGGIIMIKIKGFINGSLDAKLKTT